MAVKQSRAYDALYDTTYTVSGARDHYKQQGQAGFVLQKLPEHNNFFSDLKHYPNSTLRIQANPNIPVTLDRSFHPHQHIPQLLKWQSSPQQVNGVHMYKFCSRPLLPAGSSFTLQLRLAPQQPEQQAPLPQPEPASKDAGTQSDYRESEAQTLPWSPAWVLPTDPGVLAKQAALCAKFNTSGPEVLQLAHLTFGNGLPGGVQEVRRLEKLRAKRAFEASLPPIDDVDRLPERQAMIEAWEVQEWVEREEEIKGLQEERLGLLVQALQVREEEIAAAHREQLHKRSATMLASKAGKFAAIHTERLKTLRQLAAAKDKVTGVFDKAGTSTTILKYADYGSALYAPPQREGHFPDVIPGGAAMAGQISHIHSSSSSGGNGSSNPAKLLHPAAFMPNSIAGLGELEASLPRANAKLPSQQRPAVQQRPQRLTYQQRTNAAVQRDVETIHDMLQAAKTATGTRGIGKVWPCPLDNGPASAAVLAAAAAAATAAAAVEGPGNSRHGLRSAGGRSCNGSLAAAAAAAAATVTTGGKPAQAVRVKQAGTHHALGSQLPAGAPPLLDPDGTQAALVLLQRLLRGRAVQVQMYAGKESHLQLIREVRLGLEGTGGGQEYPEARSAAVQECDTAAGAALCRLCCLLASDDKESIAEVMSRMAAHCAQVPNHRQQQQQQLQQQQRHDIVNVTGGSEDQQQQQQQDIRQGDVESVTELAEGSGKHASNSADLVGSEQAGSGPVGDVLHEAEAVSQQGQQLPQELVQEEGTGEQVSQCMEAQGQSGCSLPGEPSMPSVGVSLVSATDAVLLAEGPAPQDEALVAERPLVNESDGATIVQPDGHNASNTDAAVEGTAHASVKEQEPATEAAVQRV